MPHTGFCALRASLLHAARKPLARARQAFSAPRAPAWCALPDTSLMRAADISLMRAADPSLAPDLHVL